VTEASRDLGATRWETFCSLLLPRARPGIATAIMLTAVPLLAEMVIPKLLGGAAACSWARRCPPSISVANYPLGSAMAVRAAGCRGIVGLLAGSPGFAEVGR